MNADCWELSQIPGYFPDHNAKADYLQSHPNDPYWMAQQLFEAQNLSGDFLEYWSLARQIKGYPDPSGP